MKRLLCGLPTCLLCLLLCACVPEAETETAPPATDTTPAVESPAPSAPEQPFAFTRENMPRLDGSTSTAPLAEAVCSYLLGESREAISDLVQFNKTSTAYYNLMYGDADLLIVGEDNADILAIKESLGFEWARAPFATDAFIFVVNENNPVDVITVEQAKAIYAGEITNWRELGGEDCEIVPFQRNSDAGSQNLMEKLVMQGTPMVEAPTEFIVASMGQLMEAVKSYDGSRGAIGYTVYYYAEEMRMAQGLKILAVEGVSPGPDTIRSEEYPLLNPKYVVIPADAAANAPNRILYNWLLGEEGQALVAREGYVAVSAERVETVGSRWYAEYTADLIPRGDYGTLVPYAGMRLMDDWPSATGCIYGLMTADGVAVTDPVYSDVFRLGYETAAGQVTHPLLVLRRGERRDGEEEARSVCAIAAADGSWCTEFRYWGLRSSRNGLLLFEGDNVTHMSPTGKILKILSLSNLGLTQGEIDNLLGEGWGGDWSGDYLTLGALNDYTAFDLLHLPSGKRVTMTVDEWGAYGLALFEPFDAPTEEELLTLLPPGEHFMVEFLWNTFSDTGLPGLLATSQYVGENQMVEIFLPDGTPLPALTHPGAWYYRVRPVGNLIEVLDLTSASYYDRDTMACVFRAYLGYERD